MTNKDAVIIMVLMVILILIGGTFGLVFGYAGTVLVMPVGFLIGWCTSYLVDKYWD